LYPCLSFDVSGNIYIISSKNVHHNCNVLCVTVQLSIYLIMKLVRLGVSNWMWIFDGQWRDNFFFNLVMHLINLYSLKADPPVM